MTTARIAEALCANTARECSYAILPPWAEGDDTAIVNAWSQVQTLRRQWAELVAIWPHKKEQFDRDIDAKIKELAAEVYEALYDLSA